jgi:hypothetical protein
MPENGKKRIKYSIKMSQRGENVVVLEKASKKQAGNMSKPEKMSQSK